MILHIIQKIFILFLFIGAGYLIIKIGIVAYDKYTLQLQINNVKSQISKLENNDEELKLLLAQLGDKEFLKLKAKENFNLKEQGEKVVIVKGISRNENDVKEKVVNKKISPWIEWWNIFFGKR